MPYQPQPSVQGCTAVSQCCVILLCASTNGRPIKSVDNGVTFTELDGTPIGDGATPVSCSGGAGPSAKEVYGFNGVPSGTPDTNDAVAYDLLTSTMYIWDPAGPSWVPVAGAAPTLDWHVTGNAATSPLSGGGTNFVGTTDATGVDVATNGATRIVVAPGGTTSFRPDGTNDRATISDLQTNVSHPHGSGNTVVSVGVNAGGFGVPGALAGYVGSDGMAVAYEIDLGGGIFQSGIVAADPGFGPQTALNATRVTGPDQSQGVFEGSTVQGSVTRLFLNANGGSDNASTELSSQRPTGETARVFTETSAGLTRSQLIAFDAGSTRTVDVRSDSIFIDAGDRTTNLPGGTDGDILTRYGAGGEVRFTPVSALSPEPFAEERVSSGGIESFTHALNVPESTMIPGTWPVTVAVYLTDGTVVTPTRVTFDVDGANVQIELPAPDTYRVYVSRAHG